LLPRLKQGADSEGAPSSRSSRPKVGGVTASDGSWIARKQMIAWRPSVLYDAVAVLPRQRARRCCRDRQAAKDFVPMPSRIASSSASRRHRGRCSTRPGSTEDLDEGCLPLGSAKDVKAFIAACGTGRYWPRELTVDLDAQPSA
jgi:catalase